MLSLLPAGCACGGRRPLGRRQGDARGARCLAAAPTHPTGSGARHGRGRMAAPNGQFFGAMSLVCPRPPTGGRRASGEGPPPCAHPPMPFSLPCGGGASWRGGKARRVTPSRRMQQCVPYVWAVPIHHPRAVTLIPWLAGSGGGPWCGWHRPTSAETGCPPPTGLPTRPRSVRFKWRWRCTGRCVPHDAPHLIGSRRQRAAVVRRRDTGGKQ